MRRPAAALLPVLLAAVPAAAQDAADPAPLVADLAALIETDYVMAERAPALVAALRGHLEAGEYDGLDDATLARRVTADLRRDSADLHFTVMPERLAPPRAEDTEEARQRHRDHVRRNGYGFRRVEILDGNVGYVEMAAFAPPELAADAADAVMAFVAGTDALIVDLRHATGGSAEMVGRLIAHLTGREPFVFNRFYWRPADATTDITTPQVTSPGYPDGPLFLLTGPTTPSAAEGFTYHLKHLGRATVVGSRTAGAAHPVVIRPAGDGFVAYVPAGRPISPLTGGNWEGTGVIPHVEVPAEEALATAHRMALQALAEANAESDPAWAARLRQLTEGMD